MTLAANSHISNDYLALGIFFSLVWQMLRVNRDGSNTSNTGKAIVLGAILGAGLMIKAYFIALVLPALLAVGRPTSSGLATVTMLAIAGPWYWRNPMLYGNLSGLVESTSVMQVVRGVVEFLWRDTIWHRMHAFLWTGNNSFQSFSHKVIEIYLPLVACGLFAYVVYRIRCPKKEVAGEWPMIVSLMMFAGAILYSTGLSFVFTKGASLGASPWYGTPLVLSLILIAFRGFGLSGRVGQFGALLLTLRPCKTCLDTH